MDTLSHSLYQAFIKIIGISHTLPVMTNITNGAIKFDGSDGEYRTTMNILTPLLEFFRAPYNYLTILVIHYTQGSYLSNFITIFLLLWMLVVPIIGILLFCFTCQKETRNVRRKSLSLQGLSKRSMRIIILLLLMSIVVVILTILVIFLNFQYVYSFCNDESNPKCQNNLGAELKTGLSRLESFIEQNKNNYPKSIEQREESQDRIISNSFHSLITQIGENMFHSLKVSSIYEQEKQIKLKMDQVYGIYTEFQQYSTIDLFQTLKRIDDYIKRTHKILDSRLDKLINSCDPESNQELRRLVTKLKNGIFEDNPIESYMLESPNNSTMMINYDFLFLDSYDKVLNDLATSMYNIYEKDYAQFLKNNLTLSEFQESYSNFLNASLEGVHVMKNFVQSQSKMILILQAALIYIPFLLIFILFILVICAPKIRCSRNGKNASLKRDLLLDSSPFYEANFSPSPQNFHTVVWQPMTVPRRPAPPSFHEDQINREETMRLARNLFQSNYDRIFDFSSDPFLITPRDEYKTFAGSRHPFQECQTLHNRPAPKRPNVLDSSKRSELLKNVQSSSRNTFIWKFALIILILTLPCFATVLINILGATLNHNVCQSWSNPQTQQSLDIELNENLYGFFRNYFHKKEFKSKNLLFRPPQNLLKTLSNELGDMDHEIGLFSASKASLLLDISRFNFTNESEEYSLKFSRHFSLNAIRILKEYDTFKLAESKSNTTRLEAQLKWKYFQRETLDKFELKRTKMRKLALSLNEAIENLRKLQTLTTEIYVKVERLGECRERAENLIDVFKIVSEYSKISYKNLHFNYNDLLVKDNALVIDLDNFLAAFNWIDPLEESISDRIELLAATIDHAGLFRIDNEQFLEQRISEIVNDSLTINRPMLLSRIVPKVFSEYLSQDQNRYLYPLSSVKGAMKQIFNAVCPTNSEERKKTLVEIVSSIAFLMTINMLTIQIFLVISFICWKCFLREEF